MRLRSWVRNLSRGSVSAVGLAAQIMLSTFILTAATFGAAWGLSEIAKYIWFLVTH